MMELSQQCRTSTQTYIDPDHYYFFNYSTTHLTLTYMHYSNQEKIPNSNVMISKSKFTVLLIYLNFARSRNAVTYT